nr:hypothetical protein [Helicobacter saguini]
MREILHANLEPFINKPIRNKHDGRVAILTKKGVSKISSDTAMDKSAANGFNDNEHIAAAEQILNLYKNARLKEIQLDLKNDKVDILIPRYIAILKLNGKKIQILITLKETLYGKNKGNRIYSIELKNIAKL